jgi:hypothetical protein
VTGASQEAQVMKRIYRYLASLPVGLMLMQPLQAETKVDYQAMIRDVELVNKTSDDLVLSFWMPAEFWRVSLTSSGRMTPQGVDDFVKVLQPYTLIAVLEGKTGIGTIDYREPDELVHAVTIEDARGNIYQPLAPDDVDPAMKGIVLAMKPMLTNMLGNMGSHMQFLFFPALSKDGQRIADPTKEGAMTVHFGNTPLRYRLPLGCFLPAAVDGKTGEQFPGNYRYNPFTGGKLVPGEQK